MKKLVAMLVILSIGLFSMGCGGETKKPAETKKPGETKPVDEKKDEKKPE
jgi:hypothetical protein